MIELHDLAGRDPEVRFSPYCWRSRFALAHKELHVRTIPWRFTDREALAFSGQGRVPVIRDGEHVVSDSWKIAIYLEREYPDRPSLFGGAVGEAHATFVNSWADTVLAPALAPLIIVDLFEIIADKDKDYFRSSREQRFGKRLEEVQAGREQRLAAFRDLLMPVRRALELQPYLGGAEPSYADHIVAGSLMWPYIASRFPLLETNDRVAGWLSGMRSLYGGLGNILPRAT
ncbi:MAG: glutathione S-transferase family protein [Hyphomicrobiaceae bacterium]